MCIIYFLLQLTVDWIRLFTNYYVNNVALTNLLCKILFELLLCIESSLSEREHYESRECKAYLLYDFGQILKT